MFFSQTFKNLKHCYGFSVVHLETLKLTFVVITLYVNTSTYFIIGIIDVYESSLCVLLFYTFFNLFVILP